MSAIVVPAPRPAPPAVLHVAQPTCGGVARYVVDAAAEQVNRGWTVTVACPDGGPLAADLDRLGIPRVPWAATRSPGPSVPRETRDLARIVAAAAPDVVHLHSAKAGLAGRLALRGRVPTLYQPHGWSWLAATGAVAAAARAWERYAQGWTTACVAVGAGEVAHARAAGLDGPIAVVRNGVDLDRFRPADRREARAALGVPDGVPLAVCPARITRQKGQDVLLAAWPAVRARCPEALLALVGEGDCDARAAAGPGVRFTGAVPDVRGWLAAADVVVLPSRWEGLSLALLEAMAAGRSTVVSAIPGLAEVVAPDAGAAVPVEDPAALAAALAGRLADPARVATEGAAAARAARAFDARDTFAALVDLTAGLVTARCARPASVTVRTAA